MERVRRSHQPQASATLFCICRRRRSYMLEPCAYIAIKPNTILLVEELWLSPSASKGSLQDIKFQASRCLCTARERARRRKRRGEVVALLQFGLEVWSLESGVQRLARMARHDKARAIRSDSYCLQSIPVPGSLADGSWRYLMRVMAILIESALLLLLFSRKPI